MNLRAQAIHGMALLAAATLAQAAPSGYVVNSDSRATSDFNSLYRVDLASGEATLIGPTGYEDVEGLALSPDGVLFGVDDATDTLIILDTNTGDGSAVNNLPGNLGLEPGFSYDFGLAFDHDGRLWLSSDTTGQVWQVDPDTGATTEVFGTANAFPPTSAPDGTKSAANPGALTGLAACGSEVSGIGSNGDERLYEVPTGGATPDLVGGLGAGLSFVDAGLDYDAEGTLWGIADRSTTVGANGQIIVLDEASIVFTIDPETGAADRVATTLVGVESLAVAGPPATCPAQQQGGTTHIPTLSMAGLAALIAGLLAVAVPVLRQRMQTFKR